MKLAFAPIVVATSACSWLAAPITATSKNVLTPAESTVIVAQPVTETARVVVEKMTERGFPLVARRVAADGVHLKFVGNRDFSGTHTLGSAFYATIHADHEGARVTIVGKPTIDHLESCPQVDDSEPACTTRTIEAVGPAGPFALGGREEAQTIRGVFAEIALDAT